MPGRNQSANRTHGGRATQHIRPTDVVSPEVAKEYNRALLEHMKLHMPFINANVARHPDNMPDTYPLLVGNKVLRMTINMAPVPESQPLELPAEGHLAIVSQETA